ncbi:MAG: four helix bundle protein [Phycisphaerales bacterium]|nr:four helix bundle protein [Phycisphaerales bacterium]
MKPASVLYRVAQAMPPDERFGLTGQMRRAVVPIPSNIAGGFGRGTRPEFLKFLRTTRGSLFGVQEDPRP